MIKAICKSLCAPCAALLLGGNALWLATDGFRALTEESARRLYAAQSRPEVPAFVLEDMDGRILRLGSGRGHDQKTTLVGFIYTTCPTICQTSGSDFAKLRDRLKETRLHEHVRVLSLSFDPTRDDPRQMRLYADLHGADGTIWTIARLQAATLSSVTGSFGVRVIPDGWGGYQHNAAIHVIDRKGRLTGIFDTDDHEGILNAVRNAP